VEEYDTVSQVCRAWWSLAGWASLWSHIILYVDEKRINELKDILETPRFSKVSELHITQVEVTNDHLEAITTSPGITCLHLASCSIDLVWPEVLSGTVTSLSSLTLSPRATSPLSSPQKLQMFFRLSEPICSLEELSLSNVTLEDVPPRILGSAVSPLRILKLRNNRLSRAQGVALLEALVDGEVKELSVVSNSLASVPPALLAALPTHLTSLELTRCGLAPTHLLPLFSSMASPTSTIRHLTLRAAVLTNVPASHLATALDSLETVSMVDCRLTPPQTDVVFHTLRENISLRVVDISRNCLSSVKPAVLARVVNRLEEANLAHCSLTKGQVHPFNPF